MEPRTGEIYHVGVYFGVPVVYNRNIEILPTGVLWRGGDYYRNIFRLHIRAIGLLRAVSPYFLSAMLRNRQVG